MADNETQHLLCRPCRFTTTLIYPLTDPALCPRLQGHRLCRQCGQPMEAQPGDHYPSPLELDRVLEHWPQQTAETIAAAVAAGKLTAYPRVGPARITGAHGQPITPGPHYYADELLALFGQPTGANAAQLPTGQATPASAAAQALDLSIVRVIST
jgi:hypothetical protein